MSSTPLQQPARWSATLVQRGRSPMVVCARPRGRPSQWWPDSWDAGSSRADEVVTIFTSDGKVMSIPKAVPPSFPDCPPPAAARLPTPAEQGLCLGSLFAISATNGVDSTRRLSVVGWCQSTEMLSEAVAYAVLRRGGEVFRVRRDVRSGVQESLTMALALPLLWGVPPEHERLRSGIQSGGGIIDRVVREFFILP